MRIPLTATLVAATVLALAGCTSDPVSTPDVSASATTTVTSTPTADSAPTVVTSAPAAAAIDRTVELRALAGEAVVMAEEVEPGRIEVTTSIVDPRGDSGSAEAVAAIAICEATVGLGANYVSVLEADGTTFVLYGHPSYGATCTEV